MPTQVASSCAAGFAGEWDTSYGKMNLTVRGNQASGSYGDGSKTISGQIQGNVLSGQWQHPNGRTGPFEFTHNGAGGFAGSWANSGGTLSPVPNWKGTCVGGTGRPGTTALKLPPDTPFRQLPPPSGAGMGDWKVNYGKYEALGGVINASPAGDGKTSYYIAPGSMLGDWRRFGALIFDKKSWGGSYYGPDSYGAYGDVVIKSGNKSARYDINADHSGNWRTYRIALSDRGWKFSGGAGSLADIVPNVTELKIRAEYGGGTDYSALRHVKFADGGTTPTTNAGSGAVSSYRHIPHTAISGHNKETLPNVSVDDCKAACDERPGCKSFDYTRPDEYKDLYCYLQEGWSQWVDATPFLEGKMKCKPKKPKG